MLEVRDIVINDLGNKPSCLPTGGVAIRSTTASRAHLLASLLLLALTLLCSACTLITGNGSLGGTSPPPSGSLSVSFIDVGQGDGVLVQAGGEEYLIDAGRAEEGPNVVDFLRSRGVDDLDGIVVSNPDADHIGGFVDVFEAFEVGVVYVSGDPKGRSPTTPFCEGCATKGPLWRWYAPDAGWIGAGCKPT
jgi:beta-lactamase superfamily II metal-dependent hydrolase